MVGALVGPRFLGPFTDLQQRGTIMQATILANKQRLMQAVAGPLPQSFPIPRASPTTGMGFNTLTPGTGPAPVPFNPAGGINMQGTDPWGTLTNTGCSFITNPTARAACMALTGLIRPGGGGGGGGSNFQVTCPEGYVSDGKGGCAIDAIGRYLPGDVGRQDFGWGATLGYYGAGYVPIESVRTHRSCPPGSKLGKDGVCYRHISRANRLHDPGARPFMTGGEVNVIRRAARLQKRGRKLLVKLMPGPKKCAPGKKRKR